MIRRAEHSDIPHLIKLGRKFYGASTWRGVLPFNEDRLAVFLNNAVPSDDALLLVSESKKSCLGAAVQHSYFSEELMAQELFWWVDPTERRLGLGADLIAELEAWAKEKSSVAVMSVLADQAGVGLAEYLERNGYKPLENLLIKEM